MIHFTIKVSYSKQIGLKMLVMNSHLQWVIQSRRKRRGQHGEEKERRWPRASLSLAVAPLYELTVALGEVGWWRSPWDELVAGM
jgi:hypothetical protein